MSDLQGKSQDPEAITGTENGSSIGNRIIIHFLRTVLQFNGKLREYRKELGAGAASFLTASFIALLYSWNEALSTVGQLSLLTNFGIGILFFALFVGSTSRLEDCIGIQLRKIYANDGYIGVFAIEGVKDAAYRGTGFSKGSNFTPNDWLQALNGKFKVSLVTNCQNLSKYGYLVNPFGERYFEEDLGNLKNFHAIKEFIRTGGVFVNVGGLAFYYAVYLEKSKNRIAVETLTGSPVETSEIIKKGEREILFPIVLPEDSSLTNTLLFRNYGVRTSIMQFASSSIEDMGFIVDDRFPKLLKPEKDIDEFRAAVRTEMPSTKLIPILRHRYYYPVEAGKVVESVRESFPIAALSFGQGYLLLCGMRLNNKQDLDYVIQTLQIFRSKLQTHDNRSLE